MLGSPAPLPKAGEEGLVLAASFAPPPTPLRSKPTWHLGALGEEDFSPGARIWGKWAACGPTTGQAPLEHPLYRTLQPRGGRVLSLLRSLLAAGSRWPGRPGPLVLCVALHKGASWGAAAAGGRWGLAPPPLTLQGCPLGKVCSLGMRCTSSLDMGSPLSSSPKFLGYHSMWCPPPGLSSSHHRVTRLPLLCNSKA